MNRSITVEEMVERNKLTWLTHTASWGRVMLVFVQLRAMSVSVALL